MFEVKNRLLKAARATAATKIRVAATLTTADVTALRTTIANTAAQVMGVMTVLAAVALLATSCGGAGQRKTATAGGADSMRFAPRYAAGYSVRAFEGYKLLEVHDPQQADGSVTRFALVDRGAQVNTPEGYTRVEVPVRGLVCMTTLQLSNIIALDRLDVVKGLPSTRSLQNAEVRKRIETGQTRRIGIEGNFDNETILALAPDLIVISPYKRGGYDMLRQLGTPLLPHFGYKETTPLGQAEWMRCMGLLLGCEERADSLFAAIEERYLALRERAATVTRRPRIFSGEIRGGNWYAVGGQSFLAALFRDAGADYVLSDDPRSGGVTLDFEQMYARAAEAEYWRIVNSFDGDFSYEALRGNDPRYADFRAWKEHGVIYCNLHQKPFYESTPVQPDVVLADFIQALHPDLLPGRQPVFYELLK